jgi:hypothetical protein
MNRGIRLAAMECAASCVLTHLEITGRNLDFFLLDYWNLLYTSNVLVAGKHVRSFPLSFFYGIDTTLCRGDVKDLALHVACGAHALLLCKASRLPFFPPNLLTHEETGFPHVILVHGQEPVSGEFRIVDPIAGHAGAIDPAVLTAASIGDGKLVYYLLTPSAEEFVQPSPAEMYAYASARNLAFYENPQLQQSGGKALELFVRDLADSVHWEAERRKRWIEQNNVTISSIITTRARVWQSFCSLGLLTEEQKQRGQEEVQSILKLWTAFNFLLIKQKRNRSDEGLLLATQRKAQEIREREHRFLKTCRRWGVNICEV